ncbi:Protein of unknown function DUF1644 [Dillenia turbinata]|uniref:Uncharacterized protein n=1 Tax=Dillenia turbinata TaxID=194707 RepID=A0AAN8ZEL5_9MAGN
MEDVLLNTNWEDVRCPICLEFPHNSVLLQCSSYEKGCRPFVCDTGHLQSNCLERFKSSFGMSVGSKSPSTSEITRVVNPLSTKSEDSCKPTCPLCRGDVTGWVIVDDARIHLDKKHRCCEEERCAFKGTFMELQKHAQIEHPHACPSKVDPARQLDWENFQQSSEIIDVLSTIHSEVPRGVVLGDYMMILEMNLRTSLEMRGIGGHRVFDNFRASRNRRRSRVGDARRGSRRSSSDEGSVTSVDFEYRVYETDEEYVGANGPARFASIRRSSRRRRSRFNYH